MEPVVPKLPRTVEQGTAPLLGWLRKVVRPSVDKLTDEVGGVARRRTVILLAAILSLDSADQGAIGAVAPNLEKALHISNVELGLLVTVTALLGGVCTIPLGSLVDRTNRIHLVSLVVLLWGVAELASSFSPSYPVLLGTRLALASVTAVAAPAVASLTGDFFPPDERGRIYGFIITGELLGAGFGVLVSGLLAGWFGWRIALGVLALPSLALAWGLFAKLPEPGRGGRSWIKRGAEAIPDPARGDDPATRSDEEPLGAGPAPARTAAVREVVKAQGVAPAGDIVVHEDPAGWSLRRAVGYVLSVRTNVIMIVSSSVGYFFFAGLKTFAVLFVRGQYGVSQGVATVLVVVVGAGAVAGVVLAGRQGDRFIGKGRVTARLDIGVGGYLAASLLLVPALLSHSLLLALPLIVVAGAALAAPNATLDAARLDVVPSQLWGRAEAVRTVVRTLLEAGAPLAFGFVSEAFGSNKGGLGVVASGRKSPAGSPAQVRGLEDAFLLMLVPLAASGLVLLLGRRSYPVDVASAAASQEEIAHERGSTSVASRDETSLAARSRR